MTDATIQARFRSVFDAAELVSVKVGGLFACVRHGMEMSDNVTQEAVDAIDRLDEVLEVARGLRKSL